MVQIILQGGTQQGANQPGENAASYSITAPNSQTIGFKSVAGATAYNIYRSVTTTPGVNSPYTLYASSISAASVASGYASYLSNSGSWGIAPGIDSVWQDTAATGCVSGTVGPTTGYYYGPTTGYTYKVTAVVGGVEGAQSASSIMVFIANGQRIMCQDLFNTESQVTWDAPNPGVASPLGFARSTLFEFLTSGGAATPYLNPYTGASCVQWNLSVAGFNYLVLDVYPVTPVPPNVFTYSTEIDGDLFLYAPGVLGYQQPAQNQWTQYKFPLSSFMTPAAGSSTAPSAAGIRQVSYYKSSWVNQGSSPINAYFEIYFSVD